MHLRIILIALALALATASLEGERSDDPLQPADATVELLDEQSEQQQDVHGMDKLKGSLRNRRRLFNSFKSYGDSPPSERPPQYSENMNRKGPISEYLSEGQKDAMAKRHGNRNDFSGEYNGFEVYKKIKPTPAKVTKVTPKAAPKAPPKPKAKAKGRAKAKAKTKVKGKVKAKAKAKGKAGSRPRPRTPSFNFNV